jgi:hypothetical protein
MPLRFRPACVHCASPKLTFLEHGSGASVYLCDECGRTSVERYDPAAVAGTARPANDFRFPSWFTGVRNR